MAILRKSFEFESTISGGDYCTILTVNVEVQTGNDDYIHSIIEICQSDTETEIELSQLSEAEQFAIKEEAADLAYDVYTDYISYVPVDEDAVYDSWADQQE